ncbi:SusC/RagA family TonB-linked outer membrane protein [Flavivirga eckloniae]|nr:TonB-dependent receptor [Flavivirga eckloniae]
MRIFVFLLCTTVFSLSPKTGFSQDAQIIINSDKIISVEQIFELIKEQTDYKFIYSYNLIKNAPPISLKKGVIRAGTLLEKGLSAIHCTYEFTDNTVIVKKKKRTVIQETITIKGSVKNDSGDFLPGVSLYVTGLDPSTGDTANATFIRGTTTDFDGTFSLEVEVGYFVTVTALGYKSIYQKITADQTTYNFTLQTSNQLDEVLVVGYGTTRKEDLTGSVGSVKSEELKQIVTQSFDQALVGQVAGLHIQTTGGAPGGSKTIVNIRGLSQISGDNQPLYIVDGVPFVTSPVTNDGFINSVSTENPLIAIDPSNIERIDILKDASSTAIYGSRAANGVIIVTTKRGKKNQAPRISYNVSTTIQNIARRNDLLNAAEHRELVTNLAQESRDNFLFYSFTDEVLDDPNFFGNADTDWQDVITNENAAWVRHNLNISGGSENVAYSLSLGTASQDGVFIESNFKRYTLGSNVDIDVTDRLKLGVSVNYNHSVNRSKDFDSYENVFNYTPDQSPFDENGNFSIQDRFLTFGNDKPFTLLGEGNQTRNRAVSHNIFGSVYGELKLADGLKFRSSINVSRNESNTNSFNTTDSERVIQNAADFSPRPGAILALSNVESTTTTFTNRLNYTKTISDIHRIDAVAGISWDASKRNGIEESYRGFPDDYILIAPSNAEFNDFRNDGSIEQGLNSIFGRVNYVYDDRYLATFTIRRDGSSQFGPGNQYGVFPSGALAWNIHNESFLENSKTINQLKVRTSLGKTGNDNTANFAYLALYNSTGFGGSIYNGIVGLLPNGVPNLNIRWEETDQLDLATEFALFNNRLYGEIGYYEKNTSGLLLNVPITLQSGSAVFNANVADVSNKGWEFTLGGDIFRSKDFTWSSSFNIATVKNNVDNLYNADSGTDAVSEGNPIGTIFGFNVTRIAQEQQEIDDLNAASPSGIYDDFLTAPGDYIFEDTNGDNVLNDDDRVALGGGGIPDYFGGWNNQIRYKNWSCNINWTYAQGIERIFTTDRTGFGSIDLSKNFSRRVFDTWAQDNTDASLARLGSFSYFRGVSSYDVVDASYIKLRSASISYSLPKDIISKLGLSNVQFTVTGNNLFSITNYPGLDPEDVGVNIPTNSVPSQIALNSSSSLTNDTGINTPNTRTYTFSLNIGL